MLCSKQWRIYGSPPPPLFWVKKEEITEGRIADRASKAKPGSPLSSRSGSATDKDINNSIYGDS